MRPQRIISVLLLWVVAVTGVSCIPCPKDISTTPEICQLGLVGQRLVLKGDQTLYKYGRPYRRLVLSTPPWQVQVGGPGEKVAIIQAGTLLRVVRVERAVYYYDGLFEIAGQLAFARIETGELAGKTVDLGLGAGRALPAANEMPQPYQLYDLPKVQK